MATNNSNDTIRVAVAQVQTSSHDLDANLQKHLHYIHEARKDNIDILMFPEYSLSGVQVSDDIFNLAMPMNHPRLKEIQQASGDMATMVGFVEEGQYAQYYNSCIVLQQGREPFIHRKLNLCTYGYWAEGKYLAPGRYLENFDLPGPFTGVALICADMWNPALVHLATLRGATVVFAPIASAVEAVSPEFHNPDNWDLTLRFYAMMYGMHIVMANLVGPQGGVNFWGGSCIVDPFGRIQQRLGHDEEGLLVADLNYHEIRKARIDLPTVRDSNLDLVQREHSRIVHDLGIPIGMLDHDHHFGRKK